MMTIIMWLVIATHTSRVIFTIPTSGPDKLETACYRPADELIRALINVSPNCTLDVSNLEMHGLTILAISTFGH